MQHQRFPHTKSRDKPYWLLEIMLCIYTASVVSVSANRILHRYSSYIGFAAFSMFLLQIAFPYYQNKVSLRKYRLFTPYIVFTCLLYLYVPLYWDIFIVLSPFTLIQIFALTSMVFVQVAINGRTWHFILGFLFGLVLLWYTGAWQIQEAVLAGQRVTLSVSEEGGGLNPNVYALYLCMFAFFVNKIISIDIKCIHSKLFRVTIFALCIFILYFVSQQIFTTTGSRKGMILLFFVYGTFLYVYPFQSQKILLSIFVPLSVLVLGFFSYKLLQESAHYHRLLSMFDWIFGDRTVVREGSVIARDAMVRRGLQLSFTNPFRFLFGHGWEGFRIYSGYSNYSHSNPIELLVNFGLFSFIFYHYFYAQVAFIAFKCRKIPNLQPEYKWIFCGVAFVMLWSLAAVIYYEKALAIFTGILAGYLVYMNGLVHFSIRPPPINPPQFPPVS